MRKKICNKCNTENPEEAIFCRHCGKRFGNKSMDSNERTGYLSVQSTPSSAMVWIDQENRGKTPLKVSLREGEHRVYISKNGFSTVQTAYVRRNETSFITAYLDNGKSQQIHSTGKIFGQSNHDRSGIIEIRCTPTRVAVKIDNRYSGMTPMKTSVTEGCHQVYLSSGGNYQTFSVNVKRGEVAYVKGNLLRGTKIRSAASAPTNNKPKGKRGCFEITIIAVVCAIVFGWWLYSHYYNGVIPFLENQDVIETMDSLEVQDYVEADTAVVESVKLLNK